MDPGENSMARHVALSHTPFHLLQLGLLAPELVARGDQVVVFHEGPVPADIPGLEGVEIVALPGFTGYRDGRRVAASNARAVTSHPLWSATEATLYCSDLKWLTNNLVYFALDRRVRTAHTVLFTDGLGSYLSRDDAMRTIVTSTSKAVLGAVGYGPRHRPLRGHHFGLDRRHARQVVGFESRRIVGDIDKRDLPLPRRTDAGPAAPGPSLVVGVPLDDHRYSRDEADRIIDTMAGTAAGLSHSGHPRWYKPHHFEAAWIAPRYLEHGFTLLEDRRPAEMLVRELGVTRLFGTYSSVLAFGPRFATAGCDAYSVCFEEFAKGYLNARDQVELRGLLVDFGVTFL